MNRGFVRGLIFAWMGCLFVTCQHETRVDVVIPPVPAAGVAPRTDLALLALGEAIARSPPSAEPYFQRARIQREMGRTDEALADIDRALELRTNEGSFLLLKAQLLHEKKRFGAALEYALRADLLDVSTPELDVLLGDLYQREGRLAKAGQYLDQALLTAPYDGSAHFVKGILLAKQADTLRALASFRRALQLDSRLPGAYEQLAQLYTQRGEYDRALEASAIGLRRYPSNGRLHFRYGLVYQRLNKPDSALMAYRRALRLDPALAEARFQTGVLLMKQRDYAGALDQFERIRHGNREFPRLWLVLAQCLEYTGQTARAQGAYVEALRAQPGDPLAAAGYARMQRKLSGYGRTMSVDTTGK